MKGVSSGKSSAHTKWPLDIDTPGKTRLAYSTPGHSFGARDRHRCRSCGRMDRDLTDCEPLDQRAVCLSCHGTLHDDFGLRGCDSVVLTEAYGG